MRTEILFNLEVPGFLSEATMISADHHHYLVVMTLMIAGMTVAEMVQKGAIKGRRRSMRTKKGNGHRPKDLEMCLLKKRTGLFL